MAPPASSTATHLTLSLRSASSLWLFAYLGCAFLCGLPAVALHFMGIGDYDQATVMSVCSQRQLQDG